MDLDVSFEAIVLDWDGTAGTDRRADATPLRSRLEALSATGVHVFVVSGADVGSIDGQLAARPSGPGRLHLCLDHGSEVHEVGPGGPVLTDSSDAATWITGWLARRGITGSLVLTVGTEPGVLPSAVRHVGGGPEALMAILDEQLERRHAGRVPWVDEDPAWIVTLPAEALMDRAAESIGALADGRAGLRAAREEDGSGAASSFLVEGMYTDGEAALMPGPVWTHLDLQRSRPDRRILDLRTGILARSSASSRLRSVRFLARYPAGTMAMRAEADAQCIAPGDPFDEMSGRPLERCARGPTTMARTRDPASGGIGVAVLGEDRTRDGLRTVERLATWRAERGSGVGWDDLVERLAEVHGVGFDHLLAGHRADWADRWLDAEVVIDGDAEVQLAARFAVFHLLSAAAGGGEVAVGARGLTGPAYGGHVFWDADVFVCPVLAAIQPGAARSMLEYRVRRLPVARAAARAGGRAGARFPWESADVGDDVTPARMPGHDGRPLAVQTGRREEHIVADVAWAAQRYVDWTDDRAFALGGGRALLVETARYWASRIELDGHIRGVMGADEYHDDVDDNVFTNAMARWNLRRAAALLAEVNGSTKESIGWVDLADGLADGWDADAGHHEQFAGYDDLEPLLASDVASPPFPADLVLGRTRVRRSQLIKQADVVMAHHLVPDELRPGSLEPDLAYYEPRTSHGSSLSPAIHACQLARAGQPDRALDLLRMACRLDLEDLTGTTAGGLHLAAMGGVWQALAHGFLGLRPRRGVLHVEPHLPVAWDGLALRLRFGGQRLAVRADHASVSIECERPLSVQVAGAAAGTCVPPETQYFLEGSSS